MARLVTRQEVITSLSGMSRKRRKFRKISLSLSLCRYVLPSFGANLFPFFIHSVENGPLTRNLFTPFQSAKMEKLSYQLDTRLNLGIWKQRRIFRFPSLPSSFSSAKRCIIFNVKIIMLKQKWTGHTTAVRGLVFTPSGSSFVSFATEDRFVDVWGIQNTENENALAALTLDNNPIMIDTHPAGQDRPSVFLDSQRNFVLPLSLTVIFFFLFFFFFLLSLGLPHLGFD
jgi:WD40 repeat protein